MVYLAMFGSFRAKRPTRHLSRGGGATRTPASSMMGLGERSLPFLLFLGRLDGPGCHTGPVVLIGCFLKVHPTQPVPDVGVSGWAGRHFFQPFRGEESHEAELLGHVPLVDPLRFHRNAWGGQFFEGLYNLDDFLYWERLAAINVCAMVIGHISDERSIRIVKGVVRPVVRLRPL